MVTTPCPDVPTRPPAGSLPGPLLLQVSASTARRVASLAVNVLRVMFVLIGFANSVVCCIVARYPPTPVPLIVLIVLAGYVAVSYAWAKIALSVLSEIRRQWGLGDTVE